MGEYRDQKLNAISLRFHPEGVDLDGTSAWATVETLRGYVYFYDEQDALEYFEWLKVRELVSAYEGGAEPLPATEVDDALAAQRLEDQP